LGWVSPARAQAALEAGRSLPLSVDPAASVRGLAFLAAALSLHVTAGLLFQEERRRRRFLRLWVMGGALIAVEALLQLGSRTARVYGLIEPAELQWLKPFGPFVNHNHFAGFMLLVLPFALGRFARRARKLRSSSLPQWAARLREPAGTAALMGGLVALVCLVALVASLSRGALLAFAGAMAVTAMRAGRKQGLQLGAVGLGVTLAALHLFGLERVEERFERSAAAAPSRTVVWADALARMPGYWLAGTGLNSFERAMSRVAPWSLPAGATPWPPPVAEALAAKEKIGFRAPALLPRLSWYREAHSDYVQVLVEAGAVGLLIALWAVVRILGSVRFDPWGHVAVLSLVLHEVVDFDLQIPALAAGFVVVAALSAAESRRRAAESAGPPAVVA
jgi:hypothetical protein